MTPVTCILQLVNHGTSTNRIPICIMLSEVPSILYSNAVMHLFGLTLLAMARQRDKLGYRATRLRRYADDGGAQPVGVRHSYQPGPMRQRGLCSQGRFWEGFHFFKASHIFFLCRYFSLRWGQKIKKIICVKFDIALNQNPSLGKRGAWAAG